MLAWLRLFRNHFIFVQIDNQFEEVVGMTAFKHDFYSRASSRCWACDLFAVLLFQEADHRALAGFLQSYHAEVWLVATEMRSDDLGGPGDLLWSQGVERVTHNWVGRGASRWVIDCMSLSNSNGTSACGSQYT